MPLRQKLKRFFATKRPTLISTPTAVFGLHASFNSELDGWSGALLAPTSPSRLLEIAKFMARARLPAPLMVHALHLAPMNSRDTGRWLVELAGYHQAVEPVRIIRPGGPAPNLEAAFAFAKARGCRILGKDGFEE